MNERRDECVNISHKQILWAMKLVLGHWSKMTHTHTPKRNINNGKPSTKHSSHIIHFKMYYNAIWKINHFIQCSHMGRMTEAAVHKHTCIVYYAIWVKFCNLLWYFVVVTMQKYFFFLYIPLRQMSKDENKSAEIIRCGKN